MKFYSEINSPKKKIDVSLIKNLEWKSIQYRKTILSIIKSANSGHIGGSLSCIDILNVLYNHVLNVSPLNIHDQNRDRYIHSKGHSVEALYTVLADKGFFPEEELKTVCQYGSYLIGHPTRKINGIEHNTGALGHGLSVAVGLALAGKIDQRNYRVFVLLGDGELEEGSNWEASMSASFYSLDNLVVIIDRNMLQITGPTDAITKLEPLQDKFISFGYAVRAVEGHNIPELIQVFSELPFEEGKPSLIIAKTTKGKGVSFMENDPDWHHRVPGDKELLAAMNELRNAEEEWKMRYEHW
jgi:transketolase